MTLSPENRALIGRDREVYTITAADLNRYLDAAREEGRRSWDMCCQSCGSGINSAAEPKEKLND